eukprot:858583-Rhodomonas_salina.3
MAYLVAICDVRANREGSMWHPVLTKRLLLPGEKDLIGCLRSYEALTTKRVPGTLLAFASCTKRPVLKFVYAPTRTAAFSPREKPGSSCYQ